MEALLDLYAEAPDPRRPVVCLDECPYALRADVRPALPAAQQRARREDTEYARCGACSLAVAVDRHRGWRHVWVAERRTAHDFAGWLRELADVHYPAAETIRLVVDNLNTHTPAALYATFPAADAHRLARKLEFHYTPKHGSWLNLVEIELSVLARQCLDRRLPTRAAVAAETAAWADARNAAGATIAWRFTTDRARTKLGHHYPT
jgi:hypothetical protein